MQKQRAAAPLPARDHDHDRCVSEAIAKADEHAARSGMRLTPLRRQVLEIVSASHRPLGAYEILEILAGTTATTRPAPPTVYRTLEFLLGAGLVHRIDSLNAFVACFGPATPHKSYFLLCERCGRATEMSDPGLGRAIANAAAAQGFAATRETVEVLGLCAACAKDSAPGRHKSET
ncbi:MAG: transcriptional repressor [Alphaproteobacteria bacterium]|nr:transcriptional repressor [Alphaproteobacteria bacterium]